jgi:hypothetical protein
LKWEVGMRKVEGGSRNYLKWEVGPVVVPNGRDYAAASMRKVEDGKDGKRKLKSEYRISNKE